jgi:hypothetical protein
VNAGGLYISSACHQRSIAFAVSRISQVANRTTACAFSVFLLSQTGIETLQTTTRFTGFLTN